MNYLLERKPPLWHKFTFDLSILETQCVDATINKYLQTRVRRVHAKFLRDKRFLISLKTNKEEHI